MDHLKVSMVICSSIAVVVFRPRRIVLAVHSSALAAVHSCRSQMFIVVIFSISFHGVELLRWHQGIGMTTDRCSSFHCLLVFYRRPHRPFPPRLPFISLTSTIGSCNSFAVVTIGYIFRSTRFTIFFQHRFLRGFVSSNCCWICEFVSTGSWFHVHLCPLLICF